MLEQLGTTEKGVDLVQHAIQAYENTKSVTFTKRNQWQGNWDEYLGNIDWSDKAPWQSKGHLPKFKQAVRVAQKTMEKAIIKADTFFNLSGKTQASISIEKDLTLGVKNVLIQSEFPQKKFGSGLFRGLLEPLIIFKTWVEPLTKNKIHKDQEFQFPIEVISAFDFYVDTTGRNKFKIHVFKKDLSDFKKLCDRGVYKKGLADVIVSDFQSFDDDMREKQRQGYVDNPRPSWRKEVELIEYWGDVDDDEGNTIYKNVTFTVVDRKYLARDPTPNPFEHGQAPFAYGPIFKIDGSEYPETFGDHVINICEMIDESYNLALDAAASEATKAFALNLDTLHDPTQAKTGIYPGKVFVTSGVAPGTTPLTEVSLGQLSAQNLMMMAALDREFQNSTGVNEFISGLVTPAGDRTATEAKIKSTQSMNYIQAISEDTERNVLAPLVQMVFKNIMQYNPEIFGERVLMIPKDEITIDYEVNGISNILQQEENFGKLMQWVGVFAKTPVGQRINWEELARMSARDLNLDSKKLILDQAQNPSVPGQAQTAPQNVDAQQQEVMAQKLMALQGGAK